MENKKNIKRARNFTDFDKNLLFEIVQNYLHIIENKKTDAVNVRAKMEAWEIIAKQFNASCQSGIRNAKQLHALYDGLKKRARKNVHEDKKELYKTGGGIFTTKSDSLDIKIRETLSVQFKHLPNSFGCFEESIANGKTIDNILTSESYVYAEAPSSESNLCMSMLKQESNDCVLTEELSNENIPEVTVDMNPSTTTATSYKRKLISSPSSAKRSCINTITDRFVERKNCKDELDAKLVTKKLKILDIEENIKMKELELKSLELENTKRNHEMELEYKKSKRKLELELLQVEINIKKAELKKNEN